jgi:hypothetical protein
MSIEQNFSYFQDKNKFNYINFIEMRMGWAYPGNIFWLPLRELGIDEKLHLL